MRVLRISAGVDPRHGGPPTSTVLSSIATARADTRVEFAVIDEGAASMSAVNRLLAEGVNVHTFPLARLPGAYRFSVSLALARWLIQRIRGFDVVHAHGAWTGSTLAAFIMAKACRIPFVITPHESLTDYDISKSNAPERALKRLLRRLLLRFANAVVFASVLERADSKAAGSLAAYVVNHPAESPRETLGSPMPLGAQAPDRDRLTLRVGFLGRVHPKKRLDLLLRALPEHASLLVAGSGPDDALESSKALAHSLGCADRVTWLGFVGEDQKAWFFDRIDLLALPSEFECFGMAAAEAIAAGVPVVVSPSTGIADIVLRYDCGIVTTPDENVMRKALSGPLRIKERSENARVAFIRELSLAHHGAALNKVYASVIQGKTRS